MVSKIILNITQIVILLRFKKNRMLVMLKIFRIFATYNNSPRTDSDYIHLKEIICLVRKWLDSFS